MSKKSTEAYFGKDASLGSYIRDAVSDIREIHNKINDFNSSNFSRNKMGIENEIKKITTKLESQIQKECNVEKCYVGIIREANAYAFPCCWDSKLIEVDKNTKKLIYNVDHALSLSDICETRNGYRFKSSKDKVFIVAFGLGLYEAGLNDDEITGVILHELGHSFQQIVLQLGTNVAMTCRTQLLQGLSDLVHPIFNKIPFFKDFTKDNNFIFSFGMTGILAIMLSSEIAGVDDAINKYGFNEVGKAVLATLWKNNKKDIDRDHLGSITRDKISNTMRNIQREKSENNILSRFFKFIAFSLFNLIMVGLRFISTPLGVLSRHCFVIGRNQEYLRKNKTAEEFADTFAIFYGYGPELASGLSKINPYNGNVDFGIGNLIYIAPGFNIFLTMMNQMDMKQLTLLHGYPMTRERISGVYKVLQFELDHNKDLSPSMKASIKMEMEQTEVVFNKYMNKTTIYSFIYNIYAKMMKKNIENTETSIVENIMEELYKMKKENSTKINKSNVDQATKAISEIPNVINNSSIKSFLQNFGLSNKGVEGIDIFNRMGMDVYINKKLYDRFDVSKVYGNYALESVNFDRKEIRFVSKNEDIY